MGIRNEGLEQAVDLVDPLLHEVELVGVDLEVLRQTLHHAGNELFKASGSFLLLAKTLQQLFEKLRCPLGLNLLKGAQGSVLVVARGAAKLCSAHRTREHHSLILVLDWRWRQAVRLHMNRKKIFEDKII